jgi:hypothetical protein
MIDTPTIAFAEAVGPSLSVGGVFVADAVDKIWSFAVVGKYRTEFCSMF